MRKTRTINIRGSWPAWIVIFLLCIAVFTTSVWVYNSVIGPMLEYQSHGGEKIFIETPFTTFNERHVKSRHLYLGEVKYDAIIIGSSRVMKMETGAFEHGQSVYNYSVAGLSASEYATAFSYLPDYPIKIYLFVDFFASNANYAYESTFPLAHRETDNLSVNLFIRSVFGQIKNCFNIKNKNLETDNNEIRMPDDLREALATQGLNADLTVPTAKEGLAQKSLAEIEEQADMRADYLLANYEYDKELLNVLKTLKRNQNYEFVVVVVPVYQELIREEFVTRRHWDDYKRLLRELVENFGEVWDFNYVNSVTADPSYWNDIDHLAENNRSMMLERIMDKKTVPNDFGILITKDNLKQQLQFLQDNISSIKAD